MRWLFTTAVATSLYVGAFACSKDEETEYNGVDTGSQQCQTFCSKHGTCDAGGESACLKDCAEAEAGAAAKGCSSELSAYLACGATAQACASVKQACPQQEAALSACPAGGSGGSGGSGTGGGAGTGGGSSGGGGA
jgi:uncharacterized membrane protein YgcG